MEPFPAADWPAQEFKIGQNPSRNQKSEARTEKAVFLVSYCEGAL